VFGYGLDWIGLLGFFFPIWGKPHLGDVANGKGGCEDLNKRRRGMCEDRKRKRRG
jgi:hypothetical protein